MYILFTFNLGGRFIGHWGVLHESRWDTGILELALHRDIEMGRLGKIEVSIYGATWTI